VVAGLLNCDICGRVIAGPAFRVRVEGAKMLVCSSCQHLGKPYQEESPIPMRSFAPGTPRMPRTIHRRAPELPRGMEESEVAEDYSNLVKTHRMKMGLSQEELAKRVKERLTVIQKIETGKIAPDSKLCRELEHELRIKLLVPRNATPAPKMAAPAEVTLGDIVRVKEKQKPAENV
jgi:putative transcription factor